MKGRQSASPFREALVRAKYDICEMLFDSGSCSHKELFTLYDRSYNKGCKVSFIDFPIDFYYSFKKDTTMLPYLKEKASTPRRLESACRLVISL